MVLSAKTLATGLDDRSLVPETMVEGKNGSRFSQLCSDTPLSSKYNLKNAVKIYFKDSGFQCHSSVGKGLAYKPDGLSLIPTTHGRHRINSAKLSSEFHMLTPAHCSCALTHTNTLTYTQTHTLTHKHTFTYTHKHTHSHTQTHINSYTHSNTNTHTHIYTLTHTHIYIHQ